MILSITLNPSMDISYQLESFNINTINRTNTSFKTSGGKGLNVSRVLKILGSDILATGFIGKGGVGNFIKSDLNKYNINHNFFEIEEDSRNCISIIHNNKQTEILETGPKISENEKESFLYHYKTLINEASLVVLSGSLPNGLDEVYYNKLIDIAKSKSLNVFLDTSKKALKYSIKNSEIFLIKPNLEELKDLLQEKISIENEILKKILSSEIFSKVTCILLSLGENGAFVKYKNDFYKVDIPKINAINTVGCGDSSLAGFIHSYLKHNNIKMALKTSMTTGILNALEEKTGFISPKNFDYYYNKISITKL